MEGQGHFLTLAPGHLHMKIKNLFFLETTGPFLRKFCMLVFRYKEMKINEHDAGHMTKMAAMPIYGKIIQKSSSPEPVDRFPLNLVCSIGDSSPS